MTDGAQHEHEDESLSHEIGYWQHLWNMLQDPSTTASGRLVMDAVLPDDGAFIARSWHAEFDREVRDHVLGASLLTGRAIVPPAAIGSAAEPLIEMALDHGFRVAVLGTASRFTVYNGTACVIPENDGRGVEAHRLVRRPAIVEAFACFFDQLWEAAIPWERCTGSAGRVSELLARGWTDERIAQELGVSTRTVNRRVSEMMRGAGVRSRFALGLRFGRSGLDAPNG